MKVLITGIAGFIGFHLARHLHALGFEVCGIDNLNTYYLPALKRARLSALPQTIHFVEQDIADAASFEACVRAQQPDVIVHLAAQAGVRHSLKQPFEYAHSNLTGHLSVLEAAARVRSVSHLIYASSSSVYGAISDAPCTEQAAACDPLSLYGATKRSGEIMASSYAHLHGTPITGLRFFTVYGSWGRPDMAYWIFSERMIAGEPIDVFNQGAMRRDMTHVSDVVRCIEAVIAQPHTALPDERPHQVFNIGYGAPQPLSDMIDHLERLTGKRAQRVLKPVPPGDVLSTWADMRKFKAAYRIVPNVALQDGLQEFYTWFADWRVSA